MLDVLFINSTDKLEVNREVNGTMLLATKLLQAGFQTRLLRFAQMESYGLKKDYLTFIRDMVEKILELDPKCVSFYTLWPYYHIMLRIAREVKEKNPEKIIIFGGPQASATAKATMEAMWFVDYICTGEGENTIVPFIRALLLEGGAGLDEVPGLYHRKDGGIVCNNIDLPLCDLDTLPQWDERLYSDYDWRGNTNQGIAMAIDAGRGCPYSCTFCCTSYFWRRTYRLKSPDRIMEDIRYFHEKFGSNAFAFSHDAFTTNNKLVEQVCDRILESGMQIRWGCASRFDCITEELVLKMKRAGMYYMELGVETGSRRMQKLTKKNLDLEKVRHMAAFLRKNKIRVTLFFMYGFPEETEQDLNETLEFLYSMLELGIQQASISFCRFNPATDITERYFDRLVLDTDIKVLLRGMYGHEEEMRVIAENKALFPFYYHLHTPVRDNYHYLYLQVNMVQKFPRTFRYVRGLYGGDNLRLYRDFIEYNRTLLEEDLDRLVHCVVEEPLEPMLNTLGGFSMPYIRQLKALLTFENDINRIKESPSDTALRRTYDFSYPDFRLDLPIAQYSEGSTEILLQKKDGKLSIHVLKISG